MDKELCIYARYVAMHRKCHTTYWSHAGTQRGCGVWLVHGAPTLNSKDKLPSHPLGLRLVVPYRTRCPQEGAQIRWLLLLVNWVVWKERNQRTFARKELSPEALLGACLVLGTSRHYLTTLNCAGILCFPFSFLVLLFLYSAILGSVFPLLLY